MKKELSEDELIAKTEERMKTAMSGKSPTDDIDEDDDDLDLDDIDDDDIDTDDDDDDDDKDKDDDDDDDDDSTSDDDDDDDDKDDDDAKDDGADDDDKELQLSDAYYRAATNSGMTKDEIVDFMAASPKLAIKTFAKMHENMNSTSQQFAEFGRARKKAEADGDDSGNTDNNNASKKSTYKKIDTAKIRDENPDSTDLVDLIDQMQEQNKSMHDQMTELAKAPVVHRDAAAEKLARDQEQLIGTQIDAFFSDPSLKPFAGTYGTTAKNSHDWSNLMPSEKVNRVAVIEQVEQLMEGAKALGQDMDVVEALGRAHLMVTQPVQEKMIREDIMKKVRKRSKGITLKPSSSKSAASSKQKKAKTHDDVIANAEKRLAKIKW